MLIKWLLTYLRGSQLSHFSLYYLEQSYAFLQILRVVMDISNMKQTSKYSSSMGSFFGIFSFPAVFVFFIGETSVSEEVLA